MVSFESATGALPRRRSSAGTPRVLAQPILAELVREALGHDLAED
jgi:hypothetical protein